MKAKYRILLNYSYLTFLFIWQALNITIFNGVDGKGRIVVLFSLFVFIINMISSRKYGAFFYRAKGIVFIWFIWFLYATINTLLLFNQPETPIVSFIGLNLFTPLVVMSLISNMAVHEIQRFLKIMQYILFLSIIILYIFSKEEDGLMGLELFDPNELSLVIIFFLVIISIRWLKKDIRLLSFLIWVILPVFYLISLGSRMAFGGFILLFLGLVFAQRVEIKPATIFKFVLFLSLISAIFLYVQENTRLGERLQETTEQAESSTHDDAEGTLFEKYGDRGVYYVLGWELFKKNPLYGIGLRNFIQYYPQVNHVEFMIQLSELGLIGFLIYLSFNFSVIKNILTNRQRASIQTKPIFTFLIFVFASIVFSASVLFLYPSIAVAGIYGTVILIITKQELNSKGKYKIITFPNT